MLRIGVDARPLSVATTGIGRYTEALIERMLKSGDQWFLYSDAPLPDRFYTIENVVVRSGKIGRKSLGTLFAQARFPGWAKRDDVQVFWSPRHHLPLLMPSSVNQVVTIHDMVWLRFPETMSVFGKYLERGLMPPSVRLAHTVIAVSQFTGDELAELLPESVVKTVVIPEAPFLQNSEARVDGEYFLFVGTLEPRKNLERLLTAYRAYVDTVSSEPLPLYICGGRGWGLPRLSEIIAELGIGKNVKLLGYVPDHDLSGLYRSARALLMPSIYEGFGLPIVEAFSQNTPVMTSEAGAMREVAGGGGLLVDPLSVSSMADGIIQLHSNLGLVHDLQRAAGARVSEFCWGQAAKDTLKVLEQAAADR
ncbi:glycosyltransferase family 4 protein [Microbulbifer sp. OS29]|uniref:Glycosyltransferase family 4 protein n=1 Tax=Microbulbifer okhotskensis TaxID=2926617 RepID=A0A9X2EPY0_9GAMM|nr:glycosyltransferase family 1 protein [Microbulbifer okhotskensis]MCO1333543.1 glycosyltransferase family 4 protein [Microbulbifer okhotskensis]